MKLVPPLPPTDLSDATAGPKTAPDDEPLGVEDEEHTAELLAIVECDIFGAQLKRRERRQGKP